MKRVSAQVGARLIHIAHQQVGNGHARIGRLGFIANHGDVVKRRVFADGFSSNHASRAGAKYQVVHGISLQSLKKRLRRAAHCRSR